MAISNQLLSKIELFCVTLSDHQGNPYDVVMSLKEIQSAVQRYNNIIKISKLILTKGNEVDIEDIKPAKYKGKPYTYEEKYGGKTNE